MFSSRDPVELDRGTSTERADYPAGPAGRAPVLFDEVTAVRDGTRFPRAPYFAAGH